MDTNIILTMVMIILVIIINVIVSKYISNRINPQKKIDQLNQYIDQLNIVTDSMNEYLKTEIEKQTQKVIDVKKDSEQEQDGDVNTNTDNTNTDNMNGDNINTDTANTDNTTSENNTNSNNTTASNNNTTIENNTTTENDITSENVIMEEDKEPTKISDSQTNNVNCFVRTITVNNINMFNNGSIGQSTIQTVIEKFVNTFEKNFKDLNLLPIGSIIYSIIPVHTNNDVFIYGQYYLRSLINSNTSMDTVYNYQLQLPDDWSKGSGFRFPNMKDRALQGKAKINYNLVESEYKNNVDRSINVTENVKKFTHTELKMVDFIQNDASTVKIQPSVRRDADFITNPSKNSTLTHGKQVSEFIFTPKVQDQQTKLFFYVVLGYTSSNSL